MFNFSSTTWRLGLRRNDSWNVFNVFICQSRSAYPFLWPTLPEAINFSSNARILVLVGGSRSYLVQNLLCATVSDLVSRTHSTHWVFNLTTIVPLLWEVYVLTGLCVYVVMRFMCYVRKSSHGNCVGAKL